LTTKFCDTVRALIGGVVAIIYDNNHVCQSCRCGRTIRPIATTLESLKVPNRLDSKNKNLDRFGHPNFAKFGAKYIKAVKKNAVLYSFHGIARKTEPDIDKVSMPIRKKNECHF
jgi:hypothetical protein